MMTMSVGGCHEVGVIDLTNLESCRAFRMSMEMDNSVSECDAPDRFQDDSGWDEGDDWSDEEDGGEKPSCSAWKAAYEEILMEDEMRLQRKKQNQAANRSLDVGSHRNAYYSDSASHASTLVSPSSSEDWSESPICESLGSVTYLHQGQLCTAQQTRAGGLVYDGQRYKSITDWLRTAFKKKL